MDYFEYRDGVLHVESVSVPTLAATVGTPLYCYSTAALVHQFQLFREPLAQRPHLLAFSAKANSNLAVLNLLARLGSGLDIVSRGEMERGLRAGIPAERMVFSGVGKRRDELKAALAAGILVFNVETAGELELLDAVARAQGQVAPVGIRVNPDVDPQTHPYIATGLQTSKFGIPIGQARDLYHRAAQMTGLEVVGVDCHIGSQMTSIAPFIEALKRILALIAELESDGHRLSYLDLGGGLGISYREDEAVPHPSELGAAVERQLADWGGYVLFEPGRAIAGNAGVFVTEVLYLKDQPGKRFVIVDGAMNDLIRPALYGAYQTVWPVQQPRESLDWTQVDVVGPVCESSDFLARDRELPPCAPGELLAVLGAGAYGATMASNYNTRPRPPEVLVAGDRFEVVRKRETIDQLLANEVIPGGGWPPVASG